MRRVYVLSSLALMLACKPTITEDPEPAPRPVSDPATDPLIEQEAVRDAVRAYAEALNHRDASAAIELVVADTFRLHEDLRLAALNATRDELEGWDLLSVIMILQSRSALTRAELEALDGQGLFALTVSEGLVGEVELFSLDEVRVDEDGALAQVRVEGVPVVWLRKATDRADRPPRWRVDFPQMMQQGGLAYEAAAQERIAASGKVRTAYILLELGTEQFLNLDILAGPLESRGEAADAP